MARNRTPKDRVGDWLFVLDNYYNKCGTPDPASGCIPWTGVVSNIGYPFFGVRCAITDKPKMVTGHRIALTLKLGRAIAPGMNANHFVCSNKLCVNPDHIEEGTQGQKLQQMRAAGLQTGRPIGGTGYAYNHKQTGRAYRYSEEEIAWVRDATIEEIQAKYNLVGQRAYNFRAAFRRGYTWLPWQSQPVAEANRANPDGSKRRGRPKKLYK